MSINGIQGTQPAQTTYNTPQTPTLYQPASTSDSSQNTGTTPAGNSPSNQQKTDQIQISNSTTLKNLDTVKAIEQLHNKMDVLIKGVRATNEALNSASEQTGRMSDTLVEITKNFPPFPVGSKKRQELLMSYTSIRQEIMKMTFPAPPSPIYETVKSTWDSMFAQNGQMLASAVPALESNSPDTQVQQTLQQVQATSNTLGSLSSATTQALVQA